MAPAQSAINQLSLCYDCVARSRKSTLHGDLRTPLASQDPHVVPHRLESVKILLGAGANLPHLYGWTCGEAVRLLEHAKPNTTRTYSMMTTAIGATAGWPSEWSANIDRLAFGVRGPSANSLDAPTLDGDAHRTQARLFVLAAGNIPWPQWPPPILGKTILSP